MNEKIYPISIIGGGSAGVMAALRCILNNDEVLFFPGSPKNKKRSRAMWVKKIENMPAHLQFKRGIEEPNQETIKWIEASAFSANFHHQKNTGIVDITKNSQGHFHLTDSRGNTYQSKYVILCTGVMDVQPTINGSIEAILVYANAQTVDYCLRCDGHHSLNKKTTIIGHGIGAAWAAIQLYERYRQPSMTILTHGQKKEFNDETEKLLQKYKIPVIEEKILQILGEEKGQKLLGFELEGNKKIESEMSFVSLGMMVYNELALKLGVVVDERGFVKADESGLTNIEGFYVAGDLKANSKKQIYTAWDQAVNSGDAINQKLRIEKRSI
ncbi:MAG: NAD(P)/FAD-dependent oxidoreductase [Bacteriovoracaceae bacterium]